MSKKLISELVPFFKFEQVGDSFFGYFEGLEYVNENMVAKFSDNEGEEWLLGGAKIARALQNSLFEKGKLYQILFKGKEKNPKTKREFNNYEIYLIEDEEGVK